MSEELREQTEELEKMLLRLEMVVDDAAKLYADAGEQKKSIVRKAADVDRILKQVPQLVNDAVRDAAGASKNELQSHREAIAYQVADSMGGAAKAFQKSAQDAQRAAEAMGKARFSFGWKHLLMNFILCPAVALYVLCAFTSSWPWELNSYGDTVEYGRSFKRVWPKLSPEIQDYIKKLAAQE